MARYVMANRRAGKFQRNEKLASREAVATSLNMLSDGIDVIRDFNPRRKTARRVVLFDADQAAIRAKEPKLPSDVIVEPEILHWSDPAYPAEFAGLRNTAVDRLPMGNGSSLCVNVRGDGEPMVGANATLFLRGVGGVQNSQQATSDDDGMLKFEFTPFWTPSALIISPAGNYWPMLIRGPVDGSDIECPPLPRGTSEWWHEVMAAVPTDPSRGAGIIVGVCDTGVGPHPCLDHVTSTGAFIGGALDKNGGADVDSHGTHVCGIIGARPQEDGQFAGIAPGVDLFSARVFPAGGGANQGDIANAIDHLSRERSADLINLSLGAPTGSQIERDAIQDAAERGTLCVCAAANSNGPVEFPAAFPETAAVSALGRLGWGPAGSIPSMRLPMEAEKFGAAGLFLANFSCFGDEVDCAGPGVGIISTVPARHGLTAPYASMGGTSMASPAVCGLLAALLADHPFYKTLPRDQSRTDTARSILRQASRDIDIQKTFQGFGLPSLR